MSAAAHGGIQVEGLIFLELSSRPSSWALRLLSVSSWVPISINSSEACYVGFYLFANGRQPPALQADSHGRGSEASARVGARKRHGRSRRYVRRQHQVDRLTLQREFRFRSISSVDPPEYMLFTSIPSISPRSSPARRREMANDIEMSQREQFCETPMPAFNKALNISSAIIQFRL